MGHKITAICCQRDFRREVYRGSDDPLTAKIAKIKIDDSLHRWYYMVGLLVESPVNFCSFCGKKLE